MVNMIYFMHIEDTSIIHVDDTYLAEQSLM